MDLKQPSMPDLSVNIGKLHLANPILLASGTCGYGQELAPFLDINILGGIVVKGISLEPMEGNPRPRIVETPCGLLNSIGLENVGLKVFLKEKLPWLRQLDTRIIVNVLGKNLEEYRTIVQKLDQVDGIDAIELNISCPNVAAGGVAFGTNPAEAARITRASRKVTSLPLIIKLSPNVTDITSIAKAVESEGADAVSLINTILGMAIDINKRRPVLSRRTGGLSGPAIKPIALRMVWDCVRAVNIPVIGIGGIASAEDALEFLIAGAKAVQIGTANLIDPGTAARVLQGIKTYLNQHDISNIEELALS